MRAGVRRWIRICWREDYFEVLCGVCDNDSFAVSIMACAETDETRQAIIDYIEQNKPTAADVSHYAAEIGRNRYSKKQGRANTANKKDKKLLRRLYDAARSLCQDRDFLIGTGSCATCDEDIQSAIDFIEWMKPTPSEILLYQIEIDQRRHPEDYIWVDEPYEEEEEREILSRRLFNEVHGLHRDKDFVMDVCSKITDLADMRRVIDLIDQKDKPSLREVTLLVDDIHQRR